MQINVEKCLLGTIILLKTMELMQLDLASMWIVTVSDCLAPLTQAAHDLYRARRHWW